MEIKLKEDEIIANIVVCAKCTTRSCHNCKIDWIEYDRPLGSTVKGVTV